MRKQTMIEQQFQALYERRQAETDARERQREEHLRGELEKLQRERDENDEQRMLIQQQLAQLLEQNASLEEAANVQKFSFTCQNAPDIQENEVQTSFNTTADVQSI